MTKTPDMDILLMITIYHGDTKEITEKNMKTAERFIDDTETKLLFSDVYDYLHDITDAQFEALDLEECYALLEDNG